MSENPTHQIINDTLPEEEFKKLTDLIIYNNKFPFTIEGCVAHRPNDEGYDKEKEEDYRNWYAGHVAYIQNVPVSDAFEPIARILTPVFQNLGMRSLLRLKVNFYPYTHEIFEHMPHKDYEFPCAAGIISLNTCDGFTRLEDGTKVESIANRLLIFDSSKPHNSSTTTNAKARYNINFNYL
jgi:histidyl-tRNA synthetase